MTLECKVLQFRVVWSRPACHLGRGTTFFFVIPGEIVACDWTPLLVAAYLYHLDDKIITLLSDLTCLQHKICHWGPQSIAQALPSVCVGWRSTVKKQNDDQRGSFGLHFSCKCFQHNPKIWKSSSCVTSVPSKPVVFGNSWSLLVFSKSLEVHAPVQAQAQPMTCPLADYMPGSLFQLIYVSYWVSHTGSGPPPCPPALLPSPIHLHSVQGEPGSHTLS